MTAGQAVVHSCMRATIQNESPPLACFMCLDFVSCRLHISASTSALTVCCPTYTSSRSPERENESILLFVWHICCLVQHWCHEVPGLCLDCKNGWCECLAAEIDLVRRSVNCILTCRCCFGGYSDPRDQATTTRLDFGADRGFRRHVCGLHKS